MITLIPSYSLEDFPVERSSEDANQLLSAWSALYHPALIENIGRLPGWDKASGPAYETPHKLVVIPPCCEWLVPGDWRYTRGDDTVMIVNESDREEIVTQALKKLELTGHGFEDWFVHAFYAMGTVYLLSELLTRQRRYMSMTNESQLQDHALNAIKGYRNGNFEDAKDSIRRFFELVQQGREYFYPVQAFFLDLTLTATTTLSARLRHALEHEKHVDLVLPSELLHKMMHEHEETLELLKKAVAEDRANIVADDPDRVPMSMLPVMELMDHLFKARIHYENILGKKPNIYMRHQHGILPNLPSILSRVGYQGMLLFSTDGWKTGEERQSRVDWQAPDGRKINTLVRYPVDANAHNQYLLLPRKLGKILESDYVPTVTFAHFPGFVQRWLHDLKTMAQFAPTIGRFYTLSGYFETTRYSGKTEKFPPSLFKSNHLVRSVEEKQENPVTSWKDRHERAVERCLSLGLATLTATLIGNKPEGNNNLKENKDGNNPDKAAAIFRQSDSLSRMTEEFAGTVAGKNEEKNGYLLVNPWNFDRNVLLDVSDLELLPEKKEPVKFARENDERKEVLVTVPGMGYAWVGPGTKTPDTIETTNEPKKRLGFFNVKPQKSQKTSTPPLFEQTEEGYFLRNDLFELRVDPTTGAVRSLHLNNRRGNRLAQQLAFRLGEKDRKNDPRSSEDMNRGYSIMSADKIEILRNGPLVASLRLAGRLMHVNGSPIATFEEIITVTGGKHVITFDIVLEPAVLPDGQPWDSYYAARIAWGSGFLEPRLGIGTGTFPTETKFLEAPYFVDFRDNNESVTILGGLPYHRRVGDRQLDSLLIVPGEQKRSFHLGIAINEEYPMPAALDFMTPDMPLVTRCASPKIPSAWLFAVEAKNVVIQRWEPIFAPRQPEPPKIDFSVREWGHGYDLNPEDHKPEPTVSPEYVPFEHLLDDVCRPMIGMRVYLLETEGRAVDVPFRSFKPIVKARTVNFLGEEEKILKIISDGAVVPIGEHELLPVEIFHIEPEAP